MMPFCNGRPAETLSSRPDLPCAQPAACVGLYDAGTRQLRPLPAFCCLWASPLPLLSSWLQALYVSTNGKALIQVNPQVRLPRTFKRFCGLMVQLLQKLSIRATNGPDKLLKVWRQHPAVLGAHGPVLLASAAPAKGDNCGAE